MNGQHSRIWWLIFVMLVIWVALGLTQPLHSEGLKRADPHQLMKSAEKAEAQKGWDEAESLFRRRAQTRFQRRRAYSYFGRLDRCHVRHAALV